MFSPAVYPNRYAIRTVMGDSFAGKIADFTPFTRHAGIFYPANDINGKLLVRVSTFCASATLGKPTISSRLYLTALILLLFSSLYRLA